MQTNRLFHCIVARPALNKSTCGWSTRYVVWPNLRCLEKAKHLIRLEQELSHTPLIQAILQKYLIMLVRVGSTSIQRFGDLPCLTNDLTYWKIIGAVKKA